MNWLSCWLVSILMLIPAAGLAQTQFVLRVVQGSNIIQAPNGSTVAMNSPAPGMPSTLQVLVTYVGSTSASFPEGVKALGSADFKAQLAAVTLAPFQTATVEVVFTPSGTALALAQLDISYLETAPPPSDNTPPGQPTRGLLTLGLSGGVPLYSVNYTIGSAGNAILLAPEGLLTFPDTVTNSSTSAAIALVNRGSSPGQVNSISVSGSAFSVASVPALPVELNASASLPFQVVYLPRQVGSDEGALTIGFEGGITQRFRLQGRGIVSQLSYEIIQSDNSSRALLPAENIEFPQTSVGHSSEVQIRFTNASGENFTVSNVSTTGAPYNLSGLPSIPPSLAPGASVIFTVAFEPTQVGQLTGSLRIGNDSFLLSGNALGLPDYTINGPSEVGPLEQPTVALTVNQPYPVALNGTLSLAVASDYATDPSVQFSSGGRVVNFTIPANTREAVFPNGANEIRFQTGSVASTFTLTPTFTTQSGIDLTPQSPLVLRFTMPASAPRLSVCISRVICHAADRRH